MTRQEEIRTLMQENIVLAVGCTEPVAVALAAAKAKEVLGKEVNRVEMFLSKNIIKNAMGVGIPGTGMIGLPIAIALGICSGKSEKGLQVLENAREYVDIAKEWLATHEITIRHKDTDEKLYIECCCHSGNEFSKAIIAQNHQNFVLVQKNDDILLHKDWQNQTKDGNSQSRDKDVASTLSAREIYDYADKTDVSFLEWIYQTAVVNEAMAKEGLTKEYGLGIGRRLHMDKDKNMREDIISYACAAADARMDGATLPVYSNSGSGNQGLVCVLPVFEYAKRKNASKEETIRALTLSNLMSIYIKNKIGRLSALCGVVNASMGAVSGMIYLEKGSLLQVCYAIRNMINTITGMACDGAKPSCALKISAGLNSAFDSMLLAMNNTVVNNTDGIAEDCIDKSIENLGRIGRMGMNDMDDLILDIMVHKKH